jgi:hypothetical protein
MRGSPIGSRDALIGRMLIKVYGGTRAEPADNLCESCRFSRIIRGRTLDEEIVICEAGVGDAMRIGFKVTSCSNYMDARLPTMGELFEKAWILKPATRHRAAGFVRGSDLREREAAEFWQQMRRRDRE